MAEPSSYPETAAVARVERPWKIVVQLLIALAAIAILAWLWNLLYDDGSWAPGLADRLEQDSWIGWILIALAALLVIEIVLLKPSYRTYLRSVGIVEFQIQAELEEFRDASGGDDFRYLVGCTGCGTVFDRPGTELTDAFSCPNCGRGGELKDRAVHKTPILDRSCERCGNPFKAYMDSPECPVCHAQNTPI